MNNLENNSIFVSKKIYLGVAGGNDPIKLLDGGILVNEHGKIIKIVTDTSEVKKIINSKHAKVFNFDDKILMPGLIDSHVHVNEPGRTEWEGFSTATKAAAVGGFTTIVDMPLNSIPATTTVENLKTKINCAKDKIYVDVAFWGGFIPENIDDIPDMIDYGVVGFKCFMCPSGVPEFPHVQKEDIQKVIGNIEKGNSVLAFHAEIDSSCCIPESEQKSFGDPVKFESYLKSRPSSFETSAVKLVLDFAKNNPKCKMHIVHLSTSDSLDIIRPVRNQCPNLTIETCHHYLSLDCNKVDDGRTEFKCCPPIRDVENRDKLWKAIQNGEIDLIVSDHSPSTAEMKLLGPTSKNTGNFLKAWGGISSNQYGLSLFWTNCKKYGLSVKDMHELMCIRPAKLCGLKNRKGYIQIGYDADFCVWDPTEEFTVRTEDIQFKNKITPYINMSLKGVVYATIVRGEVVYQNAEPFGQPIGNILLNTRMAETVL